MRGGQAVQRLGEPQGGARDEDAEHPARPGVQPGDRGGGWLEAAADLVAHHQQQEAHPEHQPGEGQGEGHPLHERHLGVVAGRGDGDRVGPAAHGRGHAAEVGPQRHGHQHGPAQGAARGKAWSSGRREASIIAAAAMLDIHMERKATPAMTSSSSRRWLPARQPDDVLRYRRVDAVPRGGRPQRKAPEKQREHRIGAPGEHRGQLVAGVQRAEQRGRGPQQQQGGDEGRHQLGEPQRQAHPGDEQGARHQGAVHAQPGHQHAGGHAQHGQGRAHPAAPVHSPRGQGELRSGAVRDGGRGGQAHEGR